MAPRDGRAPQGCDGRLAGAPALDRIKPSLDRPKRAFTMAVGPPPGGRNQPLNFSLDGDAAATEDAHGPGAVRSNRRRPRWRSLQPSFSSNRWKVAVHGIAGRHSRGRPCRPFVRAPSCVHMDRHSCSFRWLWPTSFQAALWPCVPSILRQRPGQRRHPSGPPLSTPWDSMSKAWHYPALPNHTRCLAVHESWVA